jgi:formylglycine-generating enzyme required for sulfatase activity
MRLPVTGVTWENAQAYAGWLHRSGRLPGARICDEREWERAARGADDRLYPHGQRLAGDEANIDETYGRHPLAFGPDEVGSHPASDSPFGVADLAGNVWEWARSVVKSPRIVQRGGGFYHEKVASRSNNREPGEETLREIHIGVRLCADL